MAVSGDCLPYISLNDNYLLNHLQCDTIIQPPIYKNFRKMFFDPLSIIVDDKYDINLDVNIFLKNSRNINISKPNYSFIDSINLEENSYTLTIFNLNMRSIPTNLQLFTDTVLSIPNTVTKLDLLCFTETRLDQQLVPLYQIPNYDMFTNCRNRHGGGIALYIERKFSSCMIDECTLLYYSFECLGVEFKVLNKICICLCIYRSPRGNRAEFLSTLSDILSVSFEKTNYVFITDDFNIDFITSETDNFVNDFIMLMYSFSLFPLITRPTRVTDTTASLIEHIWTTQIENNINNLILETDISDHFPIISQFKFNQSVVNPPSYKEIRIYSALSLENFKNELRQIG